MKYKNKLNTTLNPSSIMKVISRAVEIQIVAEVKLILYVFNCALIDIQCQNTSAKSAVNFFTRSDLFEIYCDLIHVSAQYIRELLITAGYLTKE